MFQNGFLFRFNGHDTVTFNHQHIFIVDLIAFRFVVVAADGLLVFHFDVLDLIGAVVYLKVYGHYRFVHFYFAVGGLCEEQSLRELWLKSIKDS